MAARDSQAALFAARKNQLEEMVAQKMAAPVRAFAREFHVAVPGFLEAYTGYLTELVRDRTAPEKLLAAVPDLLSLMAPGGRQEIETLSWAAPDPQATIRVLVTTHPSVPSPFAGEG